jgi:hypothetical protein
MFGAQARGCGFCSARRPAAVFGASQDVFNLLKARAPLTVEATAIAGEGDRRRARDLQVVAKHPVQPLVGDNLWEFAYLHFWRGCLEK